jgi:hypothetical protein
VIGQRGRNITDNIDLHCLKTTQKWKKIHYAMCGIRHQETAAKNIPFSDWVMNAFLSVSSLSLFASGKLLQKNI